MALGSVHGITSVAGAAGMSAWCGSPLLSNTLTPKSIVPAAFNRRAGPARAVLDEVAVMQAETKRAKSKVDNSGVFDLVLEHLERATSELQSAVRGASNEILNACVDLMFKPSDEVNTYFQGNFGPVAEISGKTPVKIISGEVPNNFPPGAYIRNGPNPQFGGKINTSPFGKSLFHWFEGDGMLHATYFSDDGNLPQYVNKYVETDGYKMEQVRGQATYLNAIEGDPKAMTVSYALNKLRFGEPLKTTCNTSILEHAGKWYASADCGLPIEINVSDLSTIGGYNVNGAWNRPITAHPKVDRRTGELVTIGYSAFKPFLELGIISADGQKIVHRVDLGLDRPTVIHDVGITERYNIILDWPLVTDIKQGMIGRKLMNFDTNGCARIGVMPRYGDKDSLKWFVTELNYTFHIVNSFDDGDEVVLHGLRARVPFFPSNPSMDNREWFARGLSTCKMEDAADPWVDGALFTRVHEWRMNMKTGTVMERDLTGDNFSMELPRINDIYSGKKNRYGYCCGHALEVSQARGMHMFGKLLKLDFGSVSREDAAVGAKDLPRIQVYDLEPHTYTSEPVFVARPGAVEEDDGWIVTYVNNESTDTSELVLIDAQKFDKEPVVRMQMPQRVPYGFHGNYVLTK